MSADKHIGHIAKLTHNIGEGALVNGIRTTLVDVAKQPLSFLDIDRKDFQSISGRLHTFKFQNLSLVYILKTECYQNRNGQQFHFLSWSGLSSSSWIRQSIRQLLASSA